MPDEANGHDPTPDAVARVRSRRLPVIIVVVTIVIAAIAVVVLANRDSGSVSASKAIVFTGRRPPVVVATASSSSSSGTSDVASSEPPGSTSSSSSTESSVATVVVDPVTGETVVVPPPPTVVQTTSTTTSTTSTTSTTTTTAPPACFVPATISIVFNDGTAPAKIDVSGDGVSARTFAFQFSPKANVADAKIDGLGDCGQVYEMTFTAQGGNGVACGPPPSLGGTFQTAIAGDSGAINVAPHGASC